MKFHRPLHWVRRDSLSVALVVLTILLIGLVAAGLVQRMHSTWTTLYVGDGVFRVRVASTDAERATGLGGTEPLAADQGMLLAFESDGQWGIWMKDVEYPIDVIWLDSQKKVVHIVKNMPPDSYPESFVPNEEARYVLEVAAGTVDKKAIGIGDAARFELPSKEGRG